MLKHGVPRTTLQNLIKYKRDFSRDIFRHIARDALLYNRGIQPC